MTDGEGKMIARFSGITADSPVPAERESAGLEDIEISERSRESPDKLAPEDISPMPF